METAQATHSNIQQPFALTRRSLITLAALAIIGMLGAIYL